VAQLLHRKFDRLHRQHRDPEQPVGIRLAVIREPTIGDETHRGSQAGILDSSDEQAETRAAERGVYFRLSTSSSPCRTPTERRLPMPQQLPLSGEPFLTIVVDDEPRLAFAGRWVDVVEDLSSDQRPIA
jgi:hypothetical protein